MPSFKRSIATFFAAGLMASSAIFGQTANAQDEPIKVGWTNLTEQAMLGEMAALIIERQLGLPVERVGNLGGTGLARQALLNGSIDVFPDYTGDALANVLNEDPITDPQKAYNRVAEAFQEQYDITWLEPTPFNNTYALALKRDRAEELGISTISDLEPHAADWTLGSSVEFAGRPIDGYPGMTDHYGFEFGSISPMNVGLMYSSIDAGEVDVIVAFATDARIELVDLKVLEDDKSFFPAYNAAITVRNDVLEAHPEIADAINAVMQTLDTETMIALNARADIQQIPIEQVAEDYLKEIDAIE